MDVKFKLGNSSSLNSVEQEAGQLLFTKDKNYLEMYLDVPQDNTIVRKKLDCDPGVTITWAEYQNLSYAEKHNGKVYYITDKPVTPVPIQLEWGTI